MAGSGYFESRFALTQTTELNALVLDVKDERGQVMFKGKIPTADALGFAVGNIRDFDGLMARLQGADLYLIARVVCFKDNSLAGLRPEYALRLTDGEVFRESPRGGAWLNPYNREVWDYIGDICEEVAQLGFDEIQLDYVRFPTGGPLHNLNLGSEITGGVSKPEIMAEFARYITGRLRPYGVAVAADVFGTVILSPSDAEEIGQDYVALAQIYQVLCPMLYPSHFAPGTLGVPQPEATPYEIIYKTLEASNQLLAPLGEQGLALAEVRPWLQDFAAPWLTVDGVPAPPYTAQEIEAQLQACGDAGVSAWMLWDAANNYEGYRDFVGQPYE
jgi:hypothetical protein